MSAAARLAGALAAVLALLPACAHVPDTTLDQEPPTVAFTALQRPFDGARLTVDPQTQAVRWQRANGAEWLDPITEQPQARWLNGFVDLDALPAYLAASRKQDALPVVVAYAIPNRGCSNYREGLPYGDYERIDPAPGQLCRLDQGVGGATGPDPSRGRARAGRPAGRLLRRRARDVAGGRRGRPGGCRSPRLHRRGALELAAVR